MLRFFMVLLISFIVNVLGTFSVGHAQEGGPVQWDEKNFKAAFDFGNRRGSSRLGLSKQSLHDDRGAGEGNFQIIAPLADLPGRGMHLGLELNYNSQLWQKADDDMQFDIDGDWPAPGWTLGFGKLVRVPGGSMLVDRNGARHPFSGTLNRELFQGHTTDGTFIDYTHETAPRAQSPSSWIFVSAQARYPNGTIVDFRAPGRRPGEIYPTQITDAQGNYIVISYRNNKGPEIATVTDTLGRIVTFHYETLTELEPSGKQYQRERLVAVTAPGLDGGTRPLIRLHYKNMTIRYKFNGLPPLDPVQGRPIERRWFFTREVIDAIYYPNSATGFWFGDPDSFSSYGMVRKVSERRGMTFDGSSLTEQGTVTAGTVTSERLYNYLLGPDPNLSTPPTYTTLTESWEQWENEPAKPAVTTYAVQRSSTPGTNHKLTILHPNGVRAVQWSYYKPNSPEDGAVFREETYGPFLEGGAHQLPLQQVTKHWETGDFGSLRLIALEVSDEREQVAKTEFSYGQKHNQLQEVREFDYGSATPSRKTRTEYELSLDYDARHIFNLPKSIEVYGGANMAPASRTEYVYDNRPLSDSPGVANHLKSHNPYMRTWVPRECHRECDMGRKPPCKNVCTEGHWQSDYDPTTHFRGNVTEIRRHLDAGDPPMFQTEIRRYDIAGNVIAASMSPGEENGFIFSAATQYGYPERFTRGAIDPTLKSTVTTSASYDFNTGLVVSVTDANGRVRRLSYDPRSLRRKSVEVRTPGISHVNYMINYWYDESAMTTTEGITDWGEVGFAAYTVTQLNGRGLVHRVKVAADGGLWDVIDTRYDAMDRFWKQTVPYREGEVPRWREASYDSLGRVADQRAADGSSVSHFYNETRRPNGASTTPGQTVRVRDAWGLERWTRINAFGQMQEVAEPNPEGNGSVFNEGSLLTQYEFDALGRVVSLRQGLQKRNFRHNLLGQLTHQLLPEKSKTLNDQGGYGRPDSAWSDVFSYDQRGNLSAHIDARGVRTIYDYDNDPLDRLHRVTHDLRGFGDVANPVVMSPMVEYKYVESGDVRRVHRITTEGISIEEYGYSPKGMLSSKTLNLNRGQAHPLAVEYSYDNVDRLMEIRYPAQYGMPEAPRKKVHIGYNIASRTKAVDVDGVSYGSNVSYNATGAATSVSVGPAGAQQLTESYDYDLMTGWMDRQRLTRSGSSLIDLSYNYFKTPTNGESVEPLISSAQTGRLTRVKDNLDELKSRSYRYDGLGRVIEAVMGVARADLYWTQEYGYDIYGNRTRTKAFGPADSPRCEVPSICSSPRGPELPVIKRDGLDGLSYDPLTNRITHPEFAYDASGNVTKALRADGTGHHYHYDAAGRLVMVADSANMVQERYTYGRGRQRLMTEIVERGSVSKDKYYMWSGGVVLSEYSRAADSIEWAKSYVYLGPRLLGSWRRGDAENEIVEHYHHDRLGTRVVSSPSGTIVTRQEPFAFGTDNSPFAATENNDNPFTSYDRSSISGLDYAVNRYYDPSEGRFTQVDPIGMAASRLDVPQSFNMYSYANNDPINSRDPMGLKDEYFCTVSRDSDGHTVMDCEPVHEVITGPSSPPDPPDRPESLTGGRGILPGNPPTDDRARGNAGGGAAAGPLGQNPHKRLSMGGQLDASAFSCRYFCLGLVDVSVGWLDNGDTISFFVSGGGGIGPWTFGDTFFDGGPVEPRAGMGNSASVSAQFIVSEAQNINEFEGESLVFSAGADSVSASVGFSPSGPRTLYLGYSRGKGAGLATYKTYTRAVGKPFPSYLVMPPCEAAWANPIAISSGSCR